MAAHLPARAVAVEGDLTAPLDATAMADPTLAFPASEALPVSESSAGTTSTYTENPPRRRRPGRALTALVCALAVFGLLAVGDALALRSDGDPPTGVSTDEMTTTEAPATSAPTTSAPATTTTTLPVTVPPTTEPPKPERGGQKGPGTDTPKDSKSRKGDG
jgi:hypothetical protein